MSVNAESNGWIRHLFHDSQLLSLSLATIYDIFTYSVKIACLFNWIGIYEAFTATLVFFDL